MSADKFEHVHRNKKHIFLNNFIGGIAWGLGASVGVSLLFTLLAFIASQADLVPFVGTFVSDILNFVLANSPNLRR